jgi:membrane peptidoglycan carboxypeptidase
MKKIPKPSNRPITTRSGKVLKVNQSLAERYSSMRQAKSLRKVNRLRGLPKSRIKRIAWRLHPKRLYAYWFSRDGGIMALKIIGIAIVAMFVLTLGVFAYFRKDLKSITDISASNLGGSISYYDRTGQTLLWSDYNSVKRVPVANISDISPYMRNATVAVEDKDFYKHRGFDMKGIIRAAIVDALHHGSTQGGSTITQQLVKLTHDFNQNRSITLKVKELILAVELERTYTKDDILRSYLNAAPYGPVDYGVQTAAQDYFHTNAKDLTLAQAAFLAAIPKSPAYYSKYSPYFDQELFINREHYVLDQMAAQGKITKQQLAEAKKVDVLAQVQPQQAKYAGIQAPYFVLAARDELNLKRSGSAANVGGWRVTTTLDMNLQAESEKAVQNNIPNLHRYGGDEEAMVVEDTKTGQMRALVGGVDFNDPDHGQFNYAHQAYISPGSSFKPYDYVTLLDNHTDAGAGSVLYDSQGPLPGYPCTVKGGGKDTNCLHDYDFKYPGPMTLRYALGGSRNVPAVKTMLEAVPNDTSTNRTKSINKVISTADSLMNAPDAYKCFKDGVDVNQAKSTDETQCYGASAIGDGAYLHLDQHINGVASLGRLGQSIPSTYIFKIQNATGKTIYQWKQPKGAQVVRPEAAYIVDDMASDPVASYLTNAQKWQHYKGWNTAVKTGTTNDGFDGLMMSWNTQYAVGSWVGYHTRNQSLNAAGMEFITLPLTRTVMEYALDSLHTNPVNWTQPPGIQSLSAFKSLTAYSTQGPSPTTDIYPSWYKQKSTSSAAVTIDRVSGKVATSCTPDSAKQTAGGNSVPNVYSIDIFYPPGNNASTNSKNIDTTAQDDIHKCGDSPPSINLTANDNGGGHYTITAFVSAGTHPLNDPQYAQFPGTVTFSLNGNTIKTASVSDPSDNVTFSYDATASGTLTATVTDSVLYSASATADINFTAAAVGPQSFTATKTGPALNFSWSGGTGPFTVYKDGGGAVSGCSNVTGNSCTTTGGAGTYYVQDANGNQSNKDST